MPPACSQRFKYLLHIVNSHTKSRLCPWALEWYKPMWQQAGARPTRHLQFNKSPPQNSWSCSPNMLLHQSCWLYLLNISKTWLLLSNYQSVPLMQASIILAGLLQLTSSWLTCFHSCYLSNYHTLAFIFQMAALWYPFKVQVRYDHIENPILNNGLFLYNLMEDITFPLGTAPLAALAFLLLLEITRLGLGICGSPCLVHPSLNVYMMWHFNLVPYKGHPKETFLTILFEIPVAAHPLLWH